ncbi:MAG TPA: diguanylate cyclase, partial [Patescibacteria group bacterium]|nr:diguanylate cyclase [Patescibacteria group bacterium]
MPFKDLPESEKKIIRAHPVWGADMLALFPGFGPIAEIVRYHHEWLNGTGYPEGRKGDAIPLGSRVLAVLDTFDAATHTVSRGFAKAQYGKGQFSEKEVLGIIRALSGILYDAQVVTALEAVVTSSPVVETIIGTARITETDFRPFEFDGREPLNFRQALAALFKTMKDRPDTLIFRVAPGSRMEQRTGSAVPVQIAAGIYEKLSALISRLELTRPTQFYLFSGVAKPEVFGGNPLVLLSAEAEASVAVVGPTVQLTQEMFLSVSLERLHLMLTTPQIFREPAIVKPQREPFNLESELEMLTLAQAEHAGQALLETFHREHSVQLVLTGGLSVTIRTEEEMMEYGSVVQFEAEDANTNQVIGRIVMEVDGQDGIIHLDQLHGTDDPVTGERIEPVAHWVGVAYRHKGIGTLLQLFVLAFAKQQALRFVKDQEVLPMAESLHLGLTHELGDRADLLIRNPRQDGSPFPDYTYRIRRISPRMLARAIGSHTARSSSSPLEKNTALRPKSIAWTILAGTTWFLVGFLSAAHWYVTVFALTMGTGVALDYLLEWLGTHNRKRYELIPPLAQRNVSPEHFLAGLPPRLQRTYALSIEARLRRFGLPGDFALHLIVEPVLAFVAPKKKGRKTDTASSLKQKIRELEDRLDGLARENEELTHKAYTDELTGLYNRAYYKEFMAYLWELADKEGIPVSVILVDADKFKDVNDRFGHFAGDLVLKYIASKVRRQTDRAIIKPQEIAEIAARFGGEEFVIVLPNTDLQGAQVVAERIRKAVEASVDSSTGRLTLQVPDRQGICADVVLDRGITISLGVAQRKPGESIDAFYRRIDKALYTAKDYGRNRVQISTSSPLSLVTYDIDVPVYAQAAAEEAYDDQVITGLTAYGLDFYYERLYFSDSSHYETIKRMFETLGHYSLTAPREWRLLISFDQFFLGSKVAACDIGSQTIFLHPYFFSLPQDTQLHIFYMLLIACLAKRMDTAEAMQDSRHFMDNLYRSSSPMTEYGPGQSRRTFLATALLAFAGMLEGCRNEDGLLRPSSEILSLIRKPIPAQEKAIRLWLTFKKYMQECLYNPKFGLYTADKVDFSDTHGDYASFT